MAQMGAQMAQRVCEAKIVAAVGGAPIEVSVPASDASQAKKLIEQQYGPIKSWVRHSEEVR
jgi:hypothetical protein